MAMATMDATTLTALLKEAVAAFSTRRAVVVLGRLELTHAALDATAARLAADTEFLLGHVVALPSPTPSRFFSFFRI
jgi:acyl-CoA synthetase (AMP-forming)/AMP-acid ligase II